MRGLLLLGMIVSLPHFILAAIKVEPSTSVIVGQEVLFSGEEHYGAGKFEWDFGDDAADVATGIATTHCYMRPGTYTASLTTDGTSRGTVIITVTGACTRVGSRAKDPLIVLKFEDNLNDSSGNGHTGSWANGTGAFGTGREHKAADLTGGKYISIPNFTGLDNKAGFTVSLWAKRAAMDTEGYMISLGDIFSIRTRNNGQTLYGYVTTTSGSNSSEDWYFGGENTQWHHYALVYDGTFIWIFCDGQRLFFNDRSPRQVSGNTGTASTGLFIGTNQAGGSVFNGYIDEVRIYDRVLTEHEIFTGFELWHADFHGRTKQYIYAQIPGDVAADATNRFKAMLSGGVTQTLADQTGLGKEVVFLLDNQSLAAGTYTLTCQLLNSGGTVMEEIVEEFTKSYSGAPVFGMDENNAFRLNGELYYPVTPWGLNDANISSWATQGYINTVYGKGYWPSDWTLSAWKNYLSLTQTAGLKSIGPTGWAGGGAEWQNYPVATLEQYVNDTKDHPTLVMYSWGDEPELGSPKGTGNVLRSQAFKCHALDPQHIVTTNFAGATFKAVDTTWRGGHRRQYCFMTNARLFGKKTLVTDAYGFDFYPIEWSAPSPKNGSMADLVTIIDRLNTLNYGLTPLMGFVETCDINEKDWGSDPPVYSTPWHPTPGQLKMMTWILVVHGCKGINWFPYHSGTPPENYPIMVQFLDQIERLKPVICGPVVDPGVSISVTDARIDHTERMYNDTLFIFTVRISEQSLTGQSVGSLQTATINLPSAITSTNVMLFDEDRTLTAGSNTITDTFSVNSVHIYKVYSPELPVRTTPVQAARTSRGLSVTPNPCLPGQPVFIRAGRASTFVTIHSLNGKQVGAVPLMQGSGTWQAGVNGVYLVKTADGKSVQKLVIIK